MATPSADGRRFLAVRIPIEDMERLERFAKSRERTRSQEVRLALKAWLREHDPENERPEEVAA